MTDQKSDKHSEQIQVVNRPVEQVDRSEKSDGDQFHIVGIGASAGGLEAIESFFDAMPTDTGMAFVLVQHLSPDFKSHMEELLARRTSMAIHRVENGMQVESNSIYLIPPKKEMVISGRELLLTEKSSERTFSHPIDQFFRSLANDVGRYAVGVVLSGTGTDGSRGIVDIHEAGGLVIAQDEASAKFDGMPLNAMATGVVDLVLPPPAIAKSLVRYARDGLSPEALSKQEIPQAVAEGIDRVFQLLHAQHGLDFTFYKSGTVGRRIQRRVDLKGLRSLDDYIARIEKDPLELNELYKDLLIGVTRFFRDLESYEVLKREVIPGIFDAVQEQDAIRVWSAACATGEEAYSLAILLDEERRHRKSKVEIKVFATDVHHLSLNAAARGVFSDESLTGMSDARLRQYFRKKSDGFYVTSELRRLVVFAPHNVIRDAPFTQMDLISCRNMLIYLQPMAQKKALSLFHFALKTNAILFLGPSETPGELKDEFQIINQRWKIFRKKRDVRLPIDSRLPLSTSAERIFAPAGIRSAPATRIDSQLLETYDQLLSLKMPPSILVNDSFEMLHVFGGAERFLAIRGGRPSAKITDCIIPPLKTAVSGALHHALRKRDVVRYTGLQILTNDKREEVGLTVQLITNTQTQADSLLIEFETFDNNRRNDVPAHSVVMSEMSDAQISKLESELRYTQENLQATTEEMETANEELQASNEELVASNEELQSTNEELQSVNEELYTVNAEHQRRVEELTLANEDMDNLLATTRVGVIFLDEELCIRRFTPEIARVFHLVPQDVGRVIQGFAHNLNYDLVRDLHEVLESQSEKEVNVEDRNGNPFLLRMVPYRSGAAIQGVVLTLIDISTLRETQQELERFKFMTESANDPMALMDDAGKFIYVNPAMCTALGYAGEELLRMSIVEIDKGHGCNWYRELFERTAAERVRPFEAAYVRKDDGEIPVEVSISSVHFSGKRFLFASARDISERRATEYEMRMQSLAIESTSSGILITDAKCDDQPIIYANPGFCKMTGYAESEILGRNCRFLQGVATDREVIAAMRAAIRNGQAHRTTLLNYRKDGTTFWNDLQLTPVFDERGMLTNFVGVQNDVTDQLQTQEALQESQQRAQQASLAKSEFLANMSHEIRTPMTAIMGYTEILSRHLTDPDNLNCIAIVQRNGRFLLDIISDILDISKIEAGKLVIQEDDFSVVELIEDVHLLMQIRAEEKGIDFELNYAGQIPERIQSDAKRLKQILLNLLGNAIKFTETGSVSMNVSYEIDSKHQPEFRFAVIDTGIGMSEDQLSRIFQPFSQADTSVHRKFGGTGLGLAISQRLAEMLDSRITVTSEPGKGSIFTLVLKAKMPSPLMVMPSPREFDAEKRSMRDPRTTLNGKRILVVDDRREIRLIIEHFLEEAGASVDCASNGQEGFDAVMAAEARGEPYDLAIFDVQMPVMDGLEATRRLRKSRFKKPIIALTAHAMEGNREECLNAGCTDYVSKPVDGPRLMELILDNLNADSARLPHEMEVPQEVSGAALRERTQQSQKCLSPESELRSRTKTDRPKAKVLIVEDSTDSRNMLVELLAGDGHEVFAAGNGVDAIRLATETMPDLILLDLGLEDMSGLEVIEKIKGNNLSPGSTFVAVTGMDNTAEIRAAGFDAHLLKPIELESLQNLVLKSVS
jgi:two-component system CheB/CheR fusion protein